MQPLCHLSSYPMLNHPTTSVDITDVPACSAEASKLVTRECRFRSSGNDNERAWQERPTQPEDERHVDHTVCVDGKTFHRFQRVRETVQNPLADDETTMWTICGFPHERGGDGFVQYALLKDAGVWSRSKRVAVDELASDRYEPVWADDGSPELGY